MISSSSSEDFRRLQHAKPCLRTYTPPAYRGLGIMSAAIALIAERASEFGARHVLTFVGEQNIASLKGCQRAGFHPHMLHHRTSFCFGTITRDRFDKLPDGDSRRTAKF
jgi:RimJ/RimL family protein N-acetyltransferase